MVSLKNKMLIIILGTLLLFSVSGTSIILSNDNLYEQSVTKLHNPVMNDPKEITSTYVANTELYIDDISLSLDGFDWSCVCLSSDVAVGRVSVNVSWDPLRLSVSDVVKNDVGWDYWPAPGFDFNHDVGYVNFTAMNISSYGVVGDNVEVICLNVSAGLAAVPGETYDISIVWSEVKDTGIPPESVDYYITDGTVSIKSNDDSTNGGNYDSDEYFPPNADIGGPYVGYFVNEDIVFNASKSTDVDGQILNYTWNFGDGFIGYGETIVHSYSIADDYQITLTVMDNDGLKDSESILLSIKTGNKPPENLKIEGPTNGSQNIPYTYDVSAEDPDTNDTICYVIDWGDQTNTTTSYVNDSATFEIEHTWSTYGMFTMEVYAEDMQGARSSSEKITIYIDIHPIEGKIHGYLIDVDSNNCFDGYYNYTLQAETSIKDQTSTEYLIDDDNDGVWDYMYNVTTKQLSIYSGDTEEQVDLGIYGLAIVLLLVIIGIIAYAVKMRNKDKKTAKNEKKSKKK